MNPMQVTAREIMALNRLAHQEGFVAGVVTSVAAYLAIRHVEKIGNLKMRIKSEFEK